MQELEELDGEAGKSSAAILGRLLLARRALQGSGGITRVL